MTVILSSVDYSILALILAVSLGIGILFSIKDRKSNTTEEYFLAGRKMSMLPVCLSLFVTFQSAVSLIGVPAEIYAYGTLFLLFFLAQVLTYVVGIFTVVPLMFPLRITSIFEVFLTRLYCLHRCRYIFVIAVVFAS